MTMSNGKEHAAPSEAAQWFARMRDDQRTHEEDERFNQWLAEDPEHERQYQRLEALWDGLESVRSTPTLKQLRESALAEARQASHVQLRPTHGRRWLAAAASVAVIGILGVIAYPYLPADRVYQTAVGERRAITLRDGSEIVLNTDTRVHVRYSLRERAIELDQGQAHFKVAHNPLRPFFVNAGTGVIRAIGTEFEVDRGHDQVRVALVEGKITVTSSAHVIAARPSAPGAIADVPEEVLLTPGKSVSLTAAGLSSTQPVRIEQVSAWVDGWL